MSAPRMVAENPDHFLMDDGRRPFKVAKAGLSPTLAATIRSMSALAGPEAPPESKVQFGQQDQPPPQGELTRAAPFPQPLGMSKEERPVSPPGAKFNDQLQGAQERMAAMSPKDQEARARDPLMAQLNDATDTQRASTEQARSLGIVPRATPGDAVQSPPTAPLQRGPAPAVPGIGGTAGMPGTGDIRAGTATGQAGAQMAANAAAEEGRQKADVIGGYQTRLQEMALEDKGRQEQARAKTEASMSAFRAASDEMKNISTTVDPGRYWASRSTGGKIASVIGLALGALGAGPDGINRAAGMIERAIDRDLDAQKAEHTLRLQQGRAGVEAAQSAFAMQHQIFGDDLAAGAAARASLLGLADNELKKITAGAQGPQAQAQAKALSGALQVKQGELVNQAANTAFDNNTARALANASLATKGVGGLSQASADAVTTVEGFNANVQTNGKKLLELINAYGTAESMTPGVETRMRQLANDMATDVAKMKDPASAARSDEVRLELENIFKPGFFQREASAVAGLKGYLENAEQRRQGAYASRGLTAPQSGAKIVPPHKGQH